MIRMRMTGRLEPEAKRAVERVQSEMGLGLSDAVNELIRRGANADGHARRFEPIHRELGLKIDVSSVAGALDLLASAEFGEPSADLR